MLITTYYAVIGDETTYRIGLLLSRYALHVNELSQSLKLTQPHVSHKLAKLRKYNYVSHKRTGQFVVYRFAEPWRSILLHGDINWRKLNPEYASAWSEDQSRLEKMLGSRLSEREIYPIISGPPRLHGQGQG